MESKLPAAQRKRSSSLSRIWTLILAMLMEGFIDEKLT